MTHAPDAKTVLSRYVAAVETGDADTIRASFADDATWTLAGDLPISGTWVGRQAIIDEFLATAMSYYAPGSVSLEITTHPDARPDRRGSRTSARVMPGGAGGRRTGTVMTDVPSPLHPMSKLLRRLRRHRRASERGVSFGGPTVITLYAGIC